MSKSLEEYTKAEIQEELKSKGFTGAWLVKSSKSQLFTALKDGLIPEIKDIPKAEKPEDKITYIWNTVNNRTIVIQAADTVFDNHGRVTTHKPAKRIYVKKGVYTTSDAEEIAHIESSKYFNARHPQNGFKRVNPEAQKIVQEAKAKGINLAEAKKEAERLVRAK